MQDVYVWKEFEDHSFDIVVSSGQVFEHIEYTWQTIREVSRVLKPFGLCCIMTSLVGAEHKHPLDCWRIHPDGFRALAKWGGLMPLEPKTQWEVLGHSYSSDIWQESVLIAKKPCQQLEYAIEDNDIVTPKFNRALCSMYTPRWIRYLAWVGHLPFANAVIKEQCPSLIVELGTHLADSYFTFCQTVKENDIKATCYAIDHWNGEHQAGFYDDRVYQQVNEHNNEHYSAFSYLLRNTFDEALDNFDDNSIDLLHIDGLHTYEAVKHDFETWYPKVSPGGIILMHDVVVRRVGFGVWKLWEEITGDKEHFLFTHSYGLGILRKPGAGEIADGMLKTLFHGDEDEKLSIINDLLLKAKIIDQRKLAIQDMREKNRLNNKIDNTRRELKAKKSEMDDIREKLKMARNEVGDLRPQYNNANLESKHFQQQLKEIHASRSWKASRKVIGILNKLPLLPRIARKLLSN